MIINAKSQLLNIDITTTMQITVFAVFTVYSVAITIYNAIRLQEIYQMKVREGYIFDANDFKFESFKKIYMISAICFLTGTIGGVIGIAGGIILAPLFLQMGMHP